MKSFVWPALLAFLVQVEKCCGGAGVVSLVSGTHTEFSCLALFLVFKDIFMSKANPYYKLLLPFVSAFGQFR